MKTIPNHSIVNGKSFLLTLGWILPSLAHAHVSPDHTSGALNGLSHPLLGVDHILAMLAVGLWAAQQGGRATWLVPASFVGLMAAGGMLGMAGFSLPFVEQGILTSVLILGVLIAAAVRLPLAASMTVVGLFAIFHGYAHGTEMQAGVSGISYGLGFALATGGLHACGIGIGRLAQQSSKTPLLRFAGVVIALAGLWLCLP